MSLGKLLIAEGAENAEKLLRGLCALRVLSGERLFAGEDGELSMPARQRALWVLWSAMFVASLAAVVALNRSTARVRASEVNREDVARHGFRLEESAKRVGIDFVHQAPTFDARLEHIMPQIAAMGAAVAVGDFDRDGWQDLYVTNSAEGSLNKLYRNRGDGTFVDVASAMGVADVNREGTGVSMGSLWGDFDNDGYEDLFLYKYGRPELFRNDAGRSFVRVSERAGFPAWVNANAAIWWDYDADGWLDLFLSGYWSEDIDLWHLKTTRIMPESFDTRRMADASTCSGIATTGRSRRPRRRSGSSRGAGRSPRRPPISREPGIRICFSPTTTGSPSSIPTRAAGSL